MTSSRSKQKGTGGETEVVNIFNKYFGRRVARRMPPTESYDVLVDPNSRALRVDALKVLVTRPDRGRWLVSLPLEDFLGLYDTEDGFEPFRPVSVEVKRHRKFAHHTIFEGKFHGRMGR